MGHSRYLAEIERLDPERDHLRICYLDACFEFPFDTTRSLELAFFRTFAVPAIAERLDSTGEFTERAHKRYDDTDLLISSFVEHGYDTPAGRAAVRRMNQIHGRFEIANEDFLYVLSTMVFEPIRWNVRFGWRPLVPNERLATFHFWRAVGRMMDIRGVPDSYDELERFNVNYERERFAPTAAGHRLAVAMIHMFVSKLPGVPHRLGERAIYALLDESLLGALDLPRPSEIERRTVEAALRARSRAAGLLPPRKRARLRTKLQRRTYPGGYRVEELGPPAQASGHTAGKAP